MTRRRSQSWIQRWSRPIIGAIAVLGAVLTAYLTVQSLTDQPVGCIPGAEPTGGSGCSNVLTSDYAQVFGLPLSLFGFFAYSAMAVFALVPLLANRLSKTLRKRLEEWSWFFLLIGSIAMTVFSGYLMYILAAQLQTLCPYCIASAIFSLSLFSFTLVGKHWEDLGQVFFTGVVVALVTLVGTLGVYAGVNNSEVATNDSSVIPMPESRPEPPKGWEITTTSGEAEKALAQHLNEIGAKMYGAYWCPHCYQQKQLFGKSAFDQVDYIECAPKGANAKPEACQQANIQSFPTWKINGKTYRGTQPLPKLAEISNYQGPTNFKYQSP